MVGATHLFAQGADLAQSGQAVDPSATVSTKHEPKVSVALRAPEDINTAPGIVSVLTEDDIKQFGANSLVDLLNRLTAVYVLSTYTYPDNIISIRGDTTDQYNTRVLFTIDGRPVRESIFLGDNRTLHTTFPLSAVKQVEILRGPSGVIYGASAFTGVVNVVTKGWEGKDDYLASVTYGSFDRKQAQARLSKKLGGLEVTADLNVLNDDGWNFVAKDSHSGNGKNSPAPFTRGTSMSQDGLGVNGKLKYEDFVATVYYGQNTQGSFGNNALWGPKFNSSTITNTTYSTETTAPENTSPSYLSSVERLEFKTYSQRLFVDVSYAKQVSDLWKTSASVTYNRYDSNFYYISSIEPLRVAHANDWIANWTNTFTFSPILKLAFGMQMWERNAEGREPVFASDGKTDYNLYSLNATTNPANSPFVPQSAENFYTTYLLATYKPLDILHLVAGVRANKAPGIPLVDFVPEASGVLIFSENVTAKLIYSGSFRSPSISERYRISYSTSGDPNLQPERNRAVQAQLNYYQENFRISLSGFQTNGWGLISRDSSKYKNFSSAQARGVELDGFYTYSDFLVNYGISYQRAVTNSANAGKTTESYRNVYDFYGAPTFLAKIGLGYNFQNGVQLGLYDQFVGVSPSPVPPISTSATTVVTNPAASPYHWVTLNARFELNRFFSVGQQGKNLLTLNLYGQNLLNQKVYFTEFVNNNDVTTIPGRPGQSFYGTISYQF
jgi:iron complex outermembrane receptor protein